MDSPVPAENRLKENEIKMLNMYMDLARELKKSWKMKVTVTPILVGSLGNAPNETVKGTILNRDKQKN